MAIFSKKKRHNLSGLRELALPVLFFALLLGGLLWGSTSVFATVEGEQLKSIQQAVRRATVQCYALEGRYPPSVDYLAENYGLAVDRTRYIIHYRSIGANLMPDISVLPQASEEGGRVR